MKWIPCFPQHPKGGSGASPSYSTDHNSQSWLLPGSISRMSWAHTQGLLLPCCPLTPWELSQQREHLQLIQPQHDEFSSSLNVLCRPRHSIFFKFPICSSTSSFDPLILPSSSPLLPARSRSGADFSRHPLR